MTSSTTAVVNTTLTGITIAPAGPLTLQINSTQQFNATAKDQFGTTISPAPPFVWGVTGGQIISSSGLFTAGSTAGGPFNVTASVSMESRTCRSR